MKIIGVIPARYGSTRFEGKPLAKIAGKALVEWVYLNASKARSLSELILATDDERIYTYCQTCGMNVEMTSKDHPSGTDRMLEVAHRHPADAYINIQGDEPLITGEALDALADGATNEGAEVATLITPVSTSDSALCDVNMVKVVVDKSGYALYFSRSKIPYPRDSQHASYYQHIGVYFFTREALLRFAELEPSPLELTEGLEQLRLLENGIRIFTVRTAYKPISVDVPADIVKVEALIQRMKDEGKLGW